MSAKKLNSLSDAELSKTLELKTAKLKRLQAEHAAVTKRFQAACKAEEALREELDRRAIKAGMTWDDLLYENGNGSMARHKACEAALAKLAVKGYHHGIMMSGYNPKTQQRVLMLSMLKDDLDFVDVVERGLLEVLPHVKEARSIEDSEGPADMDGLGLKGVSYKHLSVLEASCSENGSYSLAINEAEGRYEVRLARYHRHSVVCKQPSLHALLVYLAKHLPYNRGEG